MSDSILQYEILEQESKEDVIATKAWDPAIRRHVTIKEPAPHLLQDKSFVENFVEEARRLAKIQDNNVGTVYEIVPPEQADGKCYLVLEYVEKSLDDIISAGPIDAASGRLILQGALEGLHAIHKAGIYHSNIRPSSILVNPEMQVKISDFRTSWIRTYRGTVELDAGKYTPHEVWTGAEKLGPWTDLYSLGCVIYELFVGTINYNECMNPAGPNEIARSVGFGPRFREWHCNTSLRAKPLSTLNTSVDLVLASVVDRMMYKDIRDRFHCAEEALHALEKRGAKEKKGSTKEQKAETSEAETSQKPKSLGSSSDDNPILTALQKKYPESGEIIKIAEVVLLGTILMGLIIYFAT